MRLIVAQDIFVIMDQIVAHLMTYQGRTLVHSVSIAKQVTYNLKFVPLASLLSMKAQDSKESAPHANQVTSAITVKFNQLFVLQATIVKSDHRNLLLVL